MLPACDRAVAPGAKTPEYRGATAFGEFSKDVQEELDEISCGLRYPGGSSLFVEGEAPRGVFILRSGRVKLFISSGDGKTVILRMAKPGDLLGLPGTLSGRQYEVTAETLGPCQVSFIKREPFLRFMNAHQEVCLAVTEQLTNIYCTTCHEIRYLGLSRSAGEKLAQLLLEWPPSNGDTASRIKFAFKHEEVAQMIGTSRETVSRLFAEFKKKHIAELNGSTLHIRNRASLQAIAAGAPVSQQRVGERDSDSHFQPDGV